MVITLPPRRRRQPVPSLTGLDNVCLLARPPPPPPAEPTCLYISVHEADTESMMSWAQARRQGSAWRAGFGGGRPQKEGGWGSRVRDSTMAVSSKFARQEQGPGLHGA